MADKKLTKPGSQPPPWLRASKKEPPALSSSSPRAGGFFLPERQIPPAGARTRFPVPDLFESRGAQRVPRITSIWRTTVPVFASTTRISSPLSV